MCSSPSLVRELLAHCWKVTGHVGGLNDEPNVTGLVSGGTRIQTQSTQLSVQ